MKITCKKSWPVDLLQVSTLTFDHCFKVKWGHHTQTAICLLYIVTLAFNSHHEQIKYVNYPPFSTNESFYCVTISCGFCILLTTEVVP